VNRRSLHVVIVGGGIGGLCLAQGLKKAGVSVAVYERDRTRTDWLQGYVINIEPYGSRALHECLPAHLFGAFDASCAQGTRAMSIINEHLEELLRFDLVGMPTRDAVARHRCVSRISLRNVLLAGLDDIVHYDKKFQRYEEKSVGQIVAHFDDGSTAVGHVLVGADGANSKVRAQFLPHAQRVDTGIVGIAGKVPLDNETRSWMPESILDGLASVSAPKGHYMFCGSMIQRNRRADANIKIHGSDHLEAPYTGFLFDNTSDYVFWAFSARREAYPRAADLFERDGDALRQVVLGMIADITLLGDAIHSMTPFRGIGANIALVDAAVLSRKLALARQGEVSVHDAIHAYEAEMLSYGFDAVRASHEAMEQAHADSRVCKPISRVVFKTLNFVPLVERRAG
jgi:2-polyprenyl-6-methoxyphenol hydroxylase-like FAD-dependent oxidoreductase